MYKDILEEQHVNKKYSLKAQLLNEGANYSSYEAAKSAGAPEKEFVSKGAQPFPDGFKILYSNSPSGKYVYDQRTKRFYTSAADGMAWDDMQRQGPDQGRQGWQKMYGLMKNLKGANAEHYSAQKSGGAVGGGRGTQGDVIRGGENVETKTQVHPTLGLPIPILNGEYSDAKLNPQAHCAKYFNKRGGKLEDMHGKVYTIDMFNCEKPLRITSSAIHVGLK